MNEKPRPFVAKTDMDDIEMNCELCLEMTCCPDHCCDVSDLILILNIRFDFFYQWDSCVSIDCCGKCPSKEQAANNEAQTQASSQPIRPASAYRKVFNPKTWSEDFVETDEPELYIRSDASK